MSFYRGYFIQYFRRYLLLYRLIGNLKYTYILTLMTVQQQRTQHISRSIRSKTIYYSIIS